MQGISRKNTGPVPALRSLPRSEHSAENVRVPACFSVDFFNGLVI